MYIFLLNFGRISHGSRLPPKCQVSIVISSLRTEFDTDYNIDLDYAFLNIFLSQKGRIK